MERGKEQIQPPFEKPKTIEEAVRVLYHLFEIAHKEADQGSDALLTGLNTHAYLIVVINAIVDACDGPDEHHLMDAFSSRRLEDLAPKQ